MDTRVPIPYLLTREEDGGLDAVFSSGGMVGLEGGLEGRKNLTRKTGIIGAANRIPMWAWGAILVGGVLLLAGGTWWVMRKRKK